MEPFTIQIQLEPSRELSQQERESIYAGFIELAQQWESYGYVRKQFCIGLNVVPHV